MVRNVPINGIASAKSNANCKTTTLTVSSIYWHYQELRTIVLFISEYDVIIAVMNIYDKKSVRCSKCDRFIGEIDYDAVVTLPKCGRCANPLPEGDDKVMYVVSKFNKNPQSLTKPLDPTLA